jgi:hypothetical protein
MPKTGKKNKKQENQVNSKKEQTNVEELSRGISAVSLGEESRIETGDDEKQKEENAHEHTSVPFKLLSIKMENIPAYVEAAALLNPQKNQRSFCSEQYPLLKALSFLGREEEEIPAYHQEMLGIMILRASDSIKHFTDEEINYLSEVNIPRVLSLLQNFIKIGRARYGIGDKQMKRVLKSVAHFYGLCRLNQHWISWCLFQIDFLQKELADLAKDSADEKTNIEIDARVNEIVAIIKSLDEKDWPQVLEEICDSIDTLSEILGEKHPSLAVALMCLGDSSLIQQQNFDLARELLQGAQSILINYGYGHGDLKPPYPKTYYKRWPLASLLLSHLFFKHESKNQALQCLSEALGDEAAYREAYPSSLIFALNFHAELSEELGDLQLACKSIQKMLDIYEKHYDPDSFNSKLIDTLIRLATIYQKLGDPQKAFQIATRAQDTLVMWLFYLHKGSSHQEKKAKQQERRKQMLHCEEIITTCCHKSQVSRKKKKSKQKQTPEITALQTAAGLSQLDEEAQNDIWLPCENDENALERKYSHRPYIAATAFLNLVAKQGETQEVYFLRGMSTLFKNGMNIPSYHQSLVIYKMLDATSRINNLSPIFRERLSRSLSASSTSLNQMQSFFLELLEGYKARYEVVPRVLDAWFLMGKLHVFCGFEGKWKSWCLKTIKTKNYELKALLQSANAPFLSNKKAINLATELNAIFKMLGAEVINGLCTSRQQEFGNDHPLFAMALELLSVCHDEQENFDGVYNTVEAELAVYKNYFKREGLLAEERRLGGLRILETSLKLVHVYTDIRFTSILTCHRSLEILNDLFISLEPAQVLKPKDQVSIFSYQAEIYRHLKDPVQEYEALKSLLKEIETYPEVLEPDIQVTLIELARVCRKLGKNQEAIKFEKLAIFTNRINGIFSEELSEVSPPSNMKEHHLETAIEQAEAASLSTKTDERSIQAEEQLQEDQEDKKYETSEKKVSLSEEELLAAGEALQRFLESFEKDEERAAYLSRTVATYQQQNSSQPQYYLGLVSFLHLGKVYANFGNMQMQLQSLSTALEMVETPGVLDSIPFRCQIALAYQFTDIFSNIGEHLVIQDKNLTFHTRGLLQTLAAHEKQNPDKVQDGLIESINKALFHLGERRAEKKESPPEELISVAQYLNSILMAAERESRSTVEPYNLIWDPISITQAAVHALIAEPKGKKENVFPVLLQPYLATNPEWKEIVYNPKVAEDILNFLIAVGSNAFRRVFLLPNEEEPTPQMNAAPNITMKFRGFPASMLAGAAIGFFGGAPIPLPELRWRRNSSLNLTLAQNSREQTPSDDTTTASRPGFYRRHTS